MPNPTVPDFNDVAARKLADLLEKGFVITGVCFERQTGEKQPQRGFVDFAGFVGWWKAAQDDPPQRQMHKCWCTTCRPISGFGEDMRFVVCPTCGNKRCPRAHNHTLACTGSNEPGQKGSSWEHVKPITAHGVADMKGGQDD